MGALTYSISLPSGKATATHHQGPPALLPPPTSVGQVIEGRRSSSTSCTSDPARSGTRLRAGLARR